MQKTADIGKDIYQGPDNLPPAEREKVAKMLSNQRAVPVPVEWK